MFLSMDFLFDKRIEQVTGGFQAQELISFVVIGLWLGLCFIMIVSV